jgi:hypothetical protein
MNRERFCEMLRALLDGWEIEVRYLDRNIYARIRLHPTQGWLERETHPGHWSMCPLGCGHTDWRFADMGQPRGLA